MSMWGELATRSCNQHLKEMVKQLREAIKKGDKARIEFILKWMENEPFDD